MMRRVVIQHDFLGHLVRLEFLCGRLFLLLYYLFLVRWHRSSFPLRRLLSAQRLNVFLE